MAVVKKEPITTRTSAPDQAPRRTVILPTVAVTDDTGMRVSPTRSKKPGLMARIAFLSIAVWLALSGLGFFGLGYRIASQVLYLDELHWNWLFVSGFCIGIGVMLWWFVFKLRSLVLRPRLPDPGESGNSNVDTIGSTGS